MWKYGARYTAEVLIATVGSMSAAASLAYLLFPVVKLLDRRIEFLELTSILSLPFFPVQMVIGIAAGYVCAVSRIKSPFTFWVWIPPLLILGVCFASFRPSVLDDPLRARFLHFFGTSCQPPACFDQNHCTVPVFASLGYAFGAFLRLGNIFNRGSRRK
jgi:hypothetical protein